MTHEKRHALRRQQELIDAAVSKRGQETARKWLAGKEPAATCGNIRATLAFMALAAAVLVIGLAL